MFSLKRVSLFVVLIQSSFLFSLLGYKNSDYISFYGNDSSYNSNSDHTNVPCITSDYNPQHNSQMHSNFHVHATIRSFHDESSSKPMHNLIAIANSCQLYEYFFYTVIPAIFDATVKNHRVAIPGYVSDDGLRSYFLNESEFPNLNPEFKQHINQRLETYIAWIESILFDANGLFRDNLSKKQQQQLTCICADFLKEFFLVIAQKTFENQVAMYPIAKLESRNIDWKEISYVHWKNQCTSKEDIKKIYQNPCNSKLVEVYKALRCGENKKAYELGHEKVSTTISHLMFWKKEKVVSVFEQYPALYAVVEHAYQQDKYKAEQAMRKHSITVLHEAELYINRPEWNQHCDILKKRIAAAKRDVSEIKIFETIHFISPKISQLLDTSYFTADQRGILFSGGSLQHELVDEGVSIAGATISFPITQELQNTVVGFVNQSLDLNEKNNVTAAARTLDACWMILDFAQTAARYGCKYFADQASLHTAVIKGVGQSLHDTAQIILHPIKATEDFVKSFAAAGYYLGKAIYTLNEYEGIADLIETDFHQGDCLLKQKIPGPSILPLLYEYVKTVSKEDAVTCIAKMATDVMLLHGATKIISPLITQVTSAFLNCMKKGSKPAKVAKTVESLSVECAEEIVQLMENTQKVGGSAEAIAKMAKDAPKLIEAFEIAKYDSSIGNLKKLEEALYKLQNIPGALTPDGPLYKVLEYGQKVEILTDLQKIQKIKGRLSTARGAMYEVEKTMELMEAGEEIISLGKKIGGREFDIELAGKLIECKNIDWVKYIGKKAEKLKSDLCNWRSIAQNNSKKFELHSKNFIPRAWKDWLVEKGIQFIES